MWSACNVAASRSLTQEATGLSHSIVMKNIFVTEFSKFSENIWENAFVIQMYFSAIPSYLDLVHKVDMPPNRSGYCIILIFTVHFSFLCSCYLLIAMTFERFYSIIRPHKAASFNTVKRAKIIIVCVFIFACCYSIPFLFITGNFGRSCVPNRFATDNILGELYSWLTQTVILIFPFISLLTMNSVIIHTLRKRSKTQLLGSAGQAESDTHALKLKCSEKQVITTLLLITFSFLLFNVPGRVLVFFLDFYSGDTPYYYAELHLFYQIGVVTYYTNHGINFFLYVISGHKFRTALKNIFFLKTGTKNDNVASNVTSTVAMSSSN